MSLVERAAKRIEELGKAGGQVARDAADHLTAQQAELNASEVAAQALESRQQLPTAAENLPKGTIALNADRRPSLASEPRREPMLGNVLERLTSPVQTSMPPLNAPPRSRRTIELDFKRLAQAGYLQPQDSESVMANEFRRIKRPLIQASQGKTASPGEHANRIMVTSSVPGEGKTFVALNLALSMATERDNTVLLVDADTTHQKLSQLLAIQSQPGLLDLLAGKNVELPDALLHTNVGRLTVLPAGARRPHATELLASEAMENLVTHIASRYADRILIFDAPPLLGAPEPSVLATHMGQIIVVVEAERTTHKVLTDALATIETCPRIAMVLNKTAKPGTSYYYYG